MALQVAASALAFTPFPKEAPGNLDKLGLGPRHQRRGGDGTQQISWLYARPELPAVCRKYSTFCVLKRAWKGSKTVLNTSAGSYTDGNGEGGGKVAVCKNNPCRASRAHSIQRAQVVVSEHKSPFLPPVAHTQCKAHL